MIARKITIILRGKTTTDVEDAFDHAVELIANGVREHKASDATYGFYFVNTDDVPVDEVL